MKSRWGQHISVFIFSCIFSFGATAQVTIPPTSSWAQVKSSGQGTISILWYDIEPFIYRDSKKNIIGVEYELMQGFTQYVSKHYNVSLKANWVDAGSFEVIYPIIKSSKEKGLFGVSFYSITAERKNEVKFSPPYMPDLNVLVSNHNVPAYETLDAFVSDLPNLKGFTMSATTMEEDIFSLKNKYFPSLLIENEENDYDVLKNISVTDNAIGYVPVSIYVVALQKGYKIKRQMLLSALREGFAAIYTKESDWDVVVDEYFNSTACNILVAELIRKYLGEEVADIILGISSGDSLKNKPSDIELLTKERELVTRRLIDTALESERNKAQRNIFLIIAFAILVIGALSVYRYKNISRLSRILQEKNKLIAEQKKSIEEMNKHLSIKILQTKLNPHFIFNSLNAIQYHVSVGDKKSTLKYMGMFSRFLRSLLKSSDEILISVTEEAALAENYLWLEQRRFEDRFTYTVNIVNGAADASTPPMLVHSLLQDALYRYILNNPSGTNLHLQLDFIKEPAALKVTVSHNAVPETTLEQSPELQDSLDVLADRIRVINQASLHTVEVKGGTRDEKNFMELKIPQPLFNTLN